MRHGQIDATYSQRGSARNAAASIGGVMLKRVDAINASAA